jgi:hypothetical protein
MYTYSYDDEGNRSARWVDEGDEELGTDDTDVTEYAWHRFGGHEPILAF